MTQEEGARCPTCGSHIPKPEQFCPICGARLPATTTGAPQRDRGDSALSRWGHWIPPVAVVAGLIILGSILSWRSDSDDTLDPVDGRPATPRSAVVEVEYRLTGSASGADITYTDGSGNIQQQTGVAVPLVRCFE